MRFESPWFLLFLILIPVYLMLKYIGMKKNIKLSPSLLFSSASLFSKKNTTIGRFFGVLGDVLLCSAIAFFIVALARPQGGTDITNEKGLGIDIVLAIDASPSMMFVDIIPKNLSSFNTVRGVVYDDPFATLVHHTRLSSAKRVISNYINKQTFNQIGIVLFGGYSITKCPLTLDKSMLQKILKDTEPLAVDGTAIGMGMATAINRLKNSQAKSKVIILLTDGQNNTGMIEPSSAAQIARDLHIRIYTIGVGNPRGFLAPTTQAPARQYLFIQQQHFNPQALKEIADMTGGKFYHAEDSKSLEQIYNDIDKLEKSRIEIKRRILYKENYTIFLTIGLIILGAYILFTGLVIKLP